MKKMQTQTYNSYKYFSLLGENSKQITRKNGVCVVAPEYNVDSVADPRVFSKYINNEDLNLPLPVFAITCKEKNKPKDDRKKLIKNLLEQIPETKLELFASRIYWEIVDEFFIEKKIKPWIQKKINEYIGENEPSLVQFICEKINNKTEPQQILSDLKMVLDDEAEVFMLKLWRLVIYEIEIKRHNLNAIFENTNSKQNESIKETENTKDSPKAKITKFFHPKIQSPAISSTCSPMPLQKPVFPNNGAIVNVSLQPSLLPAVNTPSPFKHNGNNDSFLPLAKKTAKLNGIKNEAQNLNLEQRLAQMFGRASTSASYDLTKSSPKTQTPLTNSSTSSQEFLDNSPKTFIKIATSTLKSYLHFQAISPEMSSHFHKFSPNRLTGKRKSSFENFSQSEEILLKDKLVAKKKIDLSKLPPPPIPPQILRATTTNDIRYSAKTTSPEQPCIFKCVDISRRVSSAINVELQCMIQKDLQRRLELECFKCLDEEYLNFEKRWKNEFENSSFNNNTISTTNKTTVICKSVLNISCDTSNDNIFGIDYSVRMANLPHFKKKESDESDVCIVDETKTIITNKKTIVHHTLLEEVPTSDENIVEVKYLNSKKLWPKRTQVEEENLLYDFLKYELSDEDVYYLKKASKNLSEYFQKYLPEGRLLNWTEPNHIKKPQEFLSPYKYDKYEFYYNDPDLEGIVPHSSGGARTQGYYKVSKQKKRLMRRHEHHDGRTIISTQDETAVRHMTQAAKDERAMNRRLMSFIGDNTLIRYRSKMIKFARSRIHGWGLYALQTIAADEMIIEYVGEKVRLTIADVREKRYERCGMGSSYMFRIDNDSVIDATKQGNFGRFINHSCNPNCTARVVTVDGDKRIVIYSKRLINKGEEITYDYKFAREEEASKIECLCGSKTCQKTLN